jgi:hypothetical protein
VPTPVGPAPRDPNDPDFWDWGSPDDLDGRPQARRHPARAVIAAVLIVALLLLIVASFL